MVGNPPDLLDLAAEYLVTENLSCFDTEDSEVMVAVNLELYSNAFEI